MITYFSGLKFKLILILIGSSIPVLKWYTGTTLYISRLEDYRLQCTDPNKMHEFKRDILLNVLNAHMAT